MLHRVVAGLDCVAERFEAPPRCLGAVDGDHRIVDAVRVEDGDVAVRRVALGVRRGGERQVGRQRHDAGQPLGMPQSRVQHDRAALRETGQHDAPRLDAARAFARDQFLDARLGGADARLVLAAAAELQDVVPRRHAHAHVDGHRHLRRVREDEADGRRRGKPEFGHDRREVVAVGAEAVQPDDGGIGRRAGFDFEAGKEVGHAGHCRGAGSRIRAMRKQAMLGLLAAAFAAGCANPLQSPPEHWPAVPVSAGCPALAGAYDNVGATSGKFGAALTWFVMPSDDAATRKHLEGAYRIEIAGEPGRSWTCRRGGATRSSRGAC